MQTKCTKTENEHDLQQFQNRKESKQILDGTACSLSHEGHKN